jgi:hypothetical protein
MIKKSKYVGLTKQELDEEIATQASLNTYSQATRPSTDDVVKAMATLMHLNPDERQTAFNKLGLRSHEGDGIPDGTAAHNRQSLKNAQAKKLGPKKSSVITKNV